MTQNPSSSNLSYLFHQDNEPSVSTPLGQRLQSTVNDQSKSDYTVYVIRNDKSELVAVLIEAKHTNNSSLKHAIAQVTGYFAAFEVTSHIPLVFVLTEKCVKFVLYPFRSKTKEALINAAVLELPLFNGNFPTLHTLQMIVLLAKHAFVSEETLIEISDDCKTMSRVVLQTCIATEKQVMEKMKQQLDEMSQALLKSELERAALEQKLKRKSEEVETLKAKV